nr:GNAT family N-acetyltransferase [Hyphomonas sp. Mor2]
MFDFQPRLSGDLISLVPATEADFEPLFAVAADPEIWAQHTARDRWQREVFRANFEGALADQGGLVAREIASGDVVGFSRFSQMFVGQDDMEIGWTFLARRLWGGEYNRDMKRSMLAHVLADFPRALFRIAEDNPRSRRAMEKIGGVLTDMQSMLEYGGVSHLYLTYEITRETFASWEA